MYELDDSIDTDDDASTPFTYADLFAGVGGFAAALEGFGGHHKYAVEIDKPAARVYASNWGIDPLGDITRDANDENMTVDEHDVVAGGFPCQPFSKSGAQRGMDEVRGTLFFHIEKILRARKPTLVILENVRNLAGPRHVHEWEVIIQHLRDAGYQVSDVPAIFSPHQIDPAYGGAPQVRDRVYITATRVPEGQVADPAPEPVTLPDHVRMTREWDLASDLPLDTATTIPGTELSESEVEWIDAWDEMVVALRALRARDAAESGEQPRPLPGFPIWISAWVSKTEHARQLVGAPSWKADFLRKNFELYQALLARGDAKWLRGWLKRVRQFPPSRQKLEWQAQGSESLWDCVISLRPSGLRAKRPTHLPALVAITQTPIIGPLRRRLSPREAARLQGLPDAFTFGGQRDALTYKQMGNGVNTGVVWNVLKAHVERDRNLLEATERGAAIYKAISEAPDSPREAIEQAVKRGQMRSVQTALLESGELVDETSELLVRQGAGLLQR